MSVQFGDVCSRRKGTTVLQGVDVSGVKLLCRDMSFTYVFHPLWASIGKLVNMKGETNIFWLTEKCVTQTPKFETIKFEGVRWNLSLAIWFKASAICVHAFSIRPCFANFRMASTFAELHFSTSFSKGSRWVGSRRADIITSKSHDTASCGTMFTPPYSSSSFALIIKGQWSRGRRWGMSWRRLPSLRRTKQCLTSWSLVAGSNM